MGDNFDLKQFLSENKLGAYSKATPPKKKQAVKESPQAAKVRQLVREVLSEMNGGKFNEWLKEITNTWPFIKQDLDKLGVDVNTVTPEEFAEVVKSSGKLINSDLGIYKSGETAHVSRSSFISFSKPGETLGWYDMRDGKHSITPKDYSFSAAVYPEDEKGKSLGRAD